MIDLEQQIEMPLEIEKLWNYYGNWRYEVAFSLQGGRCVYRELYEEFSQVTTIKDVISKINEDEETLVIYKFYSSKLTPMFPVYADGKLFSKVSPRKFIDRQRQQGATPFEFKSEYTLFSLYRSQKNEYFGESEIRLTSGGFNKKSCRENWNLLNTLLQKI